MATNLAFLVPTLTIVPSSGKPSLIPIFYRVPFGFGAEIISGYLSKKKVPNEIDPKRFYGHFECDCGSKWKSGNTWQGYTQGCKKCGVNSWPERVYHLEQSNNTAVGKPHKSELCEKCQELGYNCHTGSSLDEDPKSSRRISHRPASKYDKCFNKQFELHSHNIAIEPQFFQDLYEAMIEVLVTPEELREFVKGLKVAQQQWEEKGMHRQVEACQDLLDKIP